MNQCRFLIVIFLMFLSSLSFSGSIFSGGIVGNGGDSIFCVPSEENSFNGTYVLDYLIAMNENLFHLRLDDPTAPVENEIVTALKARLPDIGADLSRFLRAANQQIFSSPDLTKNYLWIAERQGLSKIDDDFIFQKIPKNCMDARGQLMAYQTVIREEGTYSVTFRYDINQLTSLKNHSPLQFSMLLLHEWAWYYASNVNVVRQVNAYLHSVEFIYDNPSQTTQKLKRLGLNLNRAPMLPEPERVGISVDSCELENFKALKVVSPKGVGVIPVISNRTDCGFTVYSASLWRGYSRTVDSMRYGKIEFKQVVIMPNDRLFIELAYSFAPDGSVIYPRAGNPVAALLVEPEE